MIKLILGDCLSKMKDIPDNSVDSIVTDPPAGISFMGKEWDRDKRGPGQLGKLDAGDSEGVLTGY